VPVLTLDPTLPPWLQAGVILLATFVSEDLTCIAVGLLVRQGQLDLALGLSSCFLGILAGDLGVWVLGRLVGARPLRWRWVQRWLPERRLEDLRRWFDQHGWTAVLAARFLPGTRVPVYLAAGVLGRQAGKFLLWAALAGLLWTPLLVLTAALAGEVVVGP